MLEYINNINIDEKLKQKVIDLVESDKVNIVSLANKCKSGSFSSLAFKNDLTRLAVVIELISSTKSRYNELGINDDILFDTLDDIRIWCENNDNKGLKNYRWLSNHINAQIFKIGRLQYQLYTCDNKKLNYKYLPFDYGDNMIYVHIPQGEKLDYSECLSSFRLAIEFFNKYFPNYNYEYFYCESWLLFEGNFEFMDVSSNILQFSTFFDIIVSYYNDNQAIERIFGSKQRNIDNYKENTTLQKRTKAFLKNGGKLGIGIGYIDKNQFL